MFYRFSSEFKKSIRRTSDVFQFKGLDVQIFELKFRPYKKYYKKLKFFEIQ